VKVSVEPDKCIAPGQCVMAAAEVFDQRDEGGIVLLLDAEPSTALADDVRHAGRCARRRRHGAGLTGARCVRTLSSQARR
jgi:ferredoxin